MLDVLLRGATVVDGSGSPGYMGDVGIQDGKIVLACGGLSACETVDASGKMLCPGFIDSHSHSDLILGWEDAYAALPKVSQGVTTEVTGQCGHSLLGVGPAKDFMEKMEALPKVINYAFAVGHGAVRQSVMGVRSEAPTPAELERMYQKVQEAMEYGSVGLTSGLIYIPGVYSTTEELVHVARAIAPYGGIYATHMRSESDFIVSALEEAITIAREAKVPLIVSHHKVCGRDNWGLSKVTLKMIHDAIGGGMNITMDQYPYEATATTLSTSIPPEYFSRGTDALVAYLKDPVTRARIKEQMLEKPAKYNSGMRNAGGFDGILVVKSDMRLEAVSKTVAQYAGEIGQDPMDVYLDLVADNRNEASAIYFSIDPNEIDAIYMDENTVVGSDGLITTKTGPTHPRAFGTFARSLTVFCKEKKLLPFEKAVRKQTGLTADRWGFAGKGYIWEGYDADLVLLNYENLHDRATYTDSRRVADGIEQVYVNGVLAYTAKGLTGAHGGRCICRKR